MGDCGASLQDFGVDVDRRAGCSATASRWSWRWQRVAPECSRHGIGPCADIEFDDTPGTRALHFFRELRRGQNGGAHSQRSVEHSRM
jgi:hypothetical protein